MNRADFQELADIRIAEAQALLALVPPKSNGAILFGRVCGRTGALKACIAKTVAQYDWPEKKFVADCHTHDVLELVRLAGLEKREPRKALPTLLGIHWDIVKDWNEESRYQRHTLTKAQKLINAITDAKNGVLPWIKLRW